jgi:YidC/Oxa1 family membrane protein insertase
MPADPTKVTNNIVPQELLSDADILVPISGPVSLFENIFQIIHIDFGLPWWASFAAVTLTLRTAALYVVVPQIRNAALMSCVQPRMSRLMRNIVTAWRQKNYIGRDMYLRSLKMLWASQGVHPARNFVSLLFNIPLFGVYFMAIRDMVKVFPSLSSESVLWLDSLSHADPLHILPFVWSGLLLISFELAIRNAAPGKILQVISWFTRAVCLLAIVFSWNVPSAMFFCWIPSTFFAMLQNYFLTQNRTVRRWFGIPNLPLDRAQITKAMNKQAGSNTQEGGSQPNPLSALKSQLPQ